MPGICEIKYKPGPDVMRVHLCSDRNSGKRPCKQKRKKKQNLTSEVQAKLNELNSFYRLSDIINANFTTTDYSVGLDYRDGEMPMSFDEGMRDVQNFIRRVQRLCRKRNLLKPKYVYVTEMSDNWRIHHHVVISCGLSEADLRKMWKYGRCNPDMLQPDENGYSALAHYFEKKPVKKEKNKTIRRWNSSKGLIHPKPTYNHNRISKKRAVRINKSGGFVKDKAIDPAEIAYIESLYQGYRLVSVRQSPINDSPFGGLFVTLFFCRADSPVYKYPPRRKKSKETEYTS